MTDGINKGADKHADVGGSHETWDGMEEEDWRSGGAGTEVELTCGNGGCVGVAGFEAERVF